MDTVFYSRKGPLISAPAVLTRLLCWCCPSPSAWGAWPGQGPGLGSDLAPDLTWPLVSLLGCPDRDFLGSFHHRILSLCPDTDQESDCVPVLQTCSAPSNPTSRHARPSPVLPARHLPAGSTGPVTASFLRAATPGLGHTSWSSGEPGGQEEEGLSFDSIAEQVWPSLPPSASQNLSLRAHGPGWAPRPPRGSLPQPSGRGFRVRADSSTRTFPAGRAPHLCSRGSSQ